jgi:Mesyanzhinovviridae DNA primase
MQIKANSTASDKVIALALRPRPSEAVKVLRLLRPGGPWLLIAIHPDGRRPIARTCTTLSSGPAEPPGEAEDFISRYNLAHEGNEARGIYYSVNPTRTAMDKKPKKTDIDAIEYMLADLDPADGETSDAAKARYLAQLEGTFEPKPTVALDSGNGVQCLWRLQERIVLGELIDGGFSPEDQAKIDDVEARAQVIMVRLGAKAGTQNIDRILRLPGTVNYPNAVKRKAGRVPCLSRLLWFDDVAYPLDAFPPGEKVMKPKSEKSKGKLHPRQQDRTGSGYGMWYFVDCRAKGMSYEEASVAILDDKAEAGEWARRVDERQIERAWAAAAVGHDVAEINASHALVIIGDKAMIMKESQKGITLLQPGAFKQWFANRYVEVGRRSVPLAKYWLEHPQRRQYEGIVFAPGERPAPPQHYNLWHGFAVAPRQGDCSKFLAHVRDNVCQGSERRFNWVMGWFAQVFQQPDQKPGTSLALRGRQGVGKSIVGEVIGSLLGMHYVAVAEPRYITGRFNAHLNSCLLLHADEAFWAGDKSAEGKLKDLVAGQTLLRRHRARDEERRARGAAALLAALRSDAD